ncbi:MAG: hypothetical protein HGA85_07740 [Nanoarchaeota archaeon]|nr:hypothetical protein [Nanoarchaeota archaeon]
MELTKYEGEALKDALEKYIPVLEAQIKDLAKMRHSSSQDKKDIKREMEKKAQLLKDILKKI